MLASKYGPRLPGSHLLALTDSTAPICVRTFSMPIDSVLWLYDAHNNVKISVLYSLPIKSCGPAALEQVSMSELTLEK